MKRGGPGRTTRKSKVHSKKSIDAFAREFGKAGKKHLGVAPGFVLSVKRTASVAPGTCIKWGIDPNTGQLICLKRAE